MDGCKESDCILLGGEVRSWDSRLTKKTSFDDADRSSASAHSFPSFSHVPVQTAEMPGFYPPGEYDLAGFAVGAVKQTEVIDGSRISEGDVILGLPSSGVHSNGFSLVRRVLELSGTSLHARAPWSPSGGLTVGESLLAPTALYVRPVLGLLEKVRVLGLVHITGGGFQENIPRVVPRGMAARVRRGAWEVPELFRWIERTGGVSSDEMYRTFNMGIGMVVVVKPQDAQAVLDAGLGALALGDIVRGDGVQLVD